ncbi:hypothetical protein [Pediococcus damnosus]|uniref:hypothetical protein n=1 Tax=Pediococcus damnosus TaxID=51663 RepID=UPI00117ED91F|nr:hypothetical protein [Pediococcus damnosus]
MFTDINIFKQSPVYYIPAQNQEKPMQSTFVIGSKEFPDQGNKIGRVILDRLLVPKFNQNVIVKIDKAIEIISKDEKVQLAFTDIKEVEVGLMKKYNADFQGPQPTFNSTVIFTTNQMDYYFLVKTSELSIQIANGILGHVKIADPLNLKQFSSLKNNSRIDEAIDRAEFENVVQGTTYEQLTQ